MFRVICTFTRAGCQFSCCLIHMILFNNFIDLNILLFMSPCNKFNKSKIILIRHSPHAINTFWSPARCVNHGSFICTVILSQLLVSQDNNTGQFQAVYTERGFHIRWNSAPSRVFSIIGYKHWTCIFFFEISLLSILLILLNFLTKKTKTEYHFTLPYLYQIPKV